MKERAAVVERGDSIPSIGMQGEGLQVGVERGYRKEIEHDMLRI